MYFNVRYKVLLNYIYIHILHYCLMCKLHSVVQPGDPRGPLHVHCATARSCGHYNECYLPKQLRVEPGHQRRLH